MSPVFHFQGHALGVAGTMRLPFQEVIETQASSVLSTAGGYASAEVKDFRYRDILKFDRAQTLVTGSRLADLEEEGSDPKRVHSTLIQAVVEGFDLLGMVTADRIEAHIVSKHVSGGIGEPEVRLKGTRFEGLKIGGNRIKVDLAVDELDAHPTHTTFRNGYSAGQFAGLFQMTEAQVNSCPDAVKRFLRYPYTKSPEELPAINGITNFSMVRTLEPEAKTDGYWGHVFYIKGFGTVRLGEINISALTRSVTMLQVDMGSPMEATFMASSGEDGGSDW